MSLKYTYRLKSKVPDIHNDISERERRKGRGGSREIEIDGKITRTL